MGLFSLLIAVVTEGHLHLPILIDVCSPCLSVRMARYGPLYLATGMAFLVSIHAH